MGLYCPNCGCVVFDKECEWCGPPELYKDNPRYCKDCGGFADHASDVKEKQEDDS